MDLQCSEVLTIHLIIVQVNGALEGKPEEEGEDIAGWNALTGQVEYRRGL